MKPRRIGVWMAVVVLGLAAVHFAGIFPTRTYLAQRAALSTAEKDLSVLTQQNDLLEDRVKLLQSDAEIERLAREHYNLVRPGEDAYALLPPPASPSTSVAKQSTGNSKDSKRADGVIQTVLDWVTNLF